MSFPSECSGRKRVQIVFAFLAFVVLGGTAIQFVELKPRRLEPVIKGKSLGYWVQAVNYRGPMGDEARTVVCQWGTNSIPLLCGWLRLNQPAYVESVFVREINELLDILNVIPWRWRHVYEPNLTALAYDVFCQLGPTGKAAIPKLIILLGDRDAETALRASRILQKMIPESVPALIEALSASNQNARALAGCALVEIGNKSDRVLPVFLEAIKGKDYAIRGYAFTDLGKMGERGKGAIPELMSMLTNAALTEDLRYDIGWAITQIDPETAAKAGVKSTLGNRSTIKASVK